MTKKDGGQISHWQIHNLTLEETQIKALKEHFPTMCFDPNPMIVTGTIVDDPTGRWQPGYHFRSSYIVKIDRENNIIESQNTIYHFDPETEGKDVIPDLGNGVLGVFY